MPGAVPTMPGVRAPPEYAERLRQDVARLLRRHSTSFPGSQPVSFLKQHIPQNLEKEDYFVCEKSDGIRCLMYLTRHGEDEATYLIDRKNDFYYVANLHFPLLDDMQKFHVDCLVDGELVLDDDGPLDPVDSTTTEDTGEAHAERKLVMRFLVFDSLVIDGKLLTERTLDKRLGYFRELVYKPYSHLCKTYPEEVSYFPFLVDFKDMEFSYALPKLWTEIVPKLKHGCDGLIFTSRSEPYIFGTDDKILKWKPADENSIDFKLFLHFPTYTDPTPPPNEEATYTDYDVQPITTLSIWTGDKNYKHYGDLYLTAEEWEKLRNLNEPLDERIVECVLDTELNAWRFLRFRDDKPNANHVTIANNVVLSVKDSVSKEDLLASANKIREAWKRRTAVQQQQEHEARRARERERERRVSSQPQQDGAVTGDKRKAV
ncbi:mRNA capping enzyme, catalytic domain-containing protein [Limtongia smithiae]|uniref:mRNA capping enzyme, catalytic domain-containing protein n=1 Tax=Limtongia smithiae TaxID=1125753 RepID=UPI0034CD1681